MTKRTQYFAVSLLFIGLTACVNKWQGTKTSKPNVILVMTDDQGFGDLGFNGNPNIHTPVLDQFAGESVRFSDFLVSSVCAPTRAALLTGRYALRTGVRDTYKGGAIMSTNEITIAEVLKRGGYRTGMIGKWHLGDNYPFRPEDQGFDYVLRHLAGGIGQWGDWPNHLKGNTSYFNPTLWENGKMVESEGYCTNVFTDAALSFIEENKQEPFFLYLAFNAPHDPLQVPDEYYQMYKDLDPAAGFENDGRPFPAMTEPMKEKARKVYAMVSNIDDNMGRLLAKVDELKLAENTLVIFMSDNGPIPSRYLGGLRGQKSSVYEGGIQVPCFWRYPASFSGNRDINITASHFDVFPTIAELCGVGIPTDREIDGVSLLPLLTGEQKKLDERSICRYWTRDYPEKYQNMMVRRGEFKLVGNCGESAEIEDFELFNLETDPYELTNIVERNNETAKALKEELDNWLNGLLQSPNLLRSPRMLIGTEHENPSVLNLNDVHFTAHEDVPKGVAYWKAAIEKAGNYKLTLHFKTEIITDCQVKLQIGKSERTFSFQKPMSDQISIGEINLNIGEADIVPVVLLKKQDGMVYEMPFYLEIKLES
ncbi:arylsulfatase [Mangrovibacterium sp.]|uniref:arylsulfatase n=1 Tax=Mangrovibacterium sp. TaxID=1961364 RepID=UPI00356739D4